MPGHDRNEGSHQHLPQLFPLEADRWLRTGLALAGIAAALLVAGLLYHARSDARWNVGKPLPQPIGFPHSVHAGKLGIACRYCHVTATAQAAAGMPSVQSCLTCHAQIWRGTPQLAPLHAAAGAGAPITWASVSRLPVHARFHHGAHARAGVTCATCHGAVETMTRTVKTETLSMGWCLDCHRAPEDSGIRPIRAASAPKSHYDGRDLTDCSVCHH